MGLKPYQRFCKFTISESKKSFKIILSVGVSPTEIVIIFEI